MGDFDIAGFKSALGVAPEKQGVVTDALLDSLKQVESGGNPKAVNKQSGAMGAYQFMPDTVKMLGKQGIKFDPYVEPEARAAAKTYLEQLVKQNNGDLNKALAQYGGFKTKDPSEYVGKVTGGQQESTGFDLAGFKSALAENKAPQQMASQFEQKQSGAPQRPVNKAEAEMDKMFGNLPGYQPTKAFLATTGETLASTPAVLGQLAGKALSTVAPESGEALYQMSTKQIKENRKVTESLREANPIATTAGDITGALINPVNKVIPFGGPAQGLTSAVAKGVGQGAIASVLTTPVTDENKAYLTEKLMQAFTGGVAGGVAGGVVKGATSLAQPVANQLSKVGNDAVKTLREAGVPIDVAQATGSSFLTKMKNVLQDNPVTVGKEQEFIATQRTAYNKAIAKTMGEDATAITPDVIANAKNRLGDVYDNLYNKYGSKISGQVYKDLAALRDDAITTLPANESSIIKNLVDDVLNKASINRSTLTGEQYQAFKRVLDRMTGQNTNTSAYAQEMKDVLLSGLKNSIKDPKDIALLKNTNKEYGNMKKIEDVVLKNPEGNISPSLLSNSLATKSKRNAIYAEDSQLADLARAGKLILEPKTPNSGTTARIMAQALPAALGGAAYGAYEGDLSGVAKGVAAGYVAPKLLQKAINNPAVARYLEEGMQPGMVRGALEIPAKVGAAVPQYMAKPGAAGATTLRDIVNLRNRQYEQENR
jgi:Transglycosylase SLT domain